MLEAGESPDHRCLRQAIAFRRPRAGLVRHSACGLQYARGEYMATLEKQGIVANMSRPANPL